MDGHKYTDASWTQKRPCSLNLQRNPNPSNSFAYARKTNSSQDGKNCLWWLQRQLSFCRLSGFDILMFPVNTVPTRLQGMNLHAAAHTAPEDHDEQHSFPSLTCLTSRPIIHDPTLTSSWANVRRIDLLMEINCATALETTNISPEA